MLKIINDGDSNEINTFTASLPNVGTENGPFRQVTSDKDFVLLLSYTSHSLYSHLYLVVTKTDAISRTKRTINDAENITTQELIEMSKQTNPDYYIAAVVYANDYNEDTDNVRMGYILGSEESTSDPNGNTFENRKLELESQLQYFTRVFSVDSSLEV